MSFTRLRLAVLMSLIALVAGSTLHGRLERRFSSWTGPAEWIWWSTRIREPKPVSFVAARTFSIQKRAAAELRIAGDRTYVVHLNGRRLGGGRGGEDMILRRFDVTDLLVVGENRIAVELRSGDGIGGLLACLSLAGVSDSYLISDNSWTIHWDWQQGVQPGPIPYASEPARSWGRPPMGPWGYTRPGRVERQPRAASGDFEALEEMWSRDGRYFTLPPDQSKGGILRVRFADQLRREVLLVPVFDGREPGAAELARTRGPNSLAGIVSPRGKGYWDSEAQYELTGAWIGGVDADEVTSVEIISSHEPLLF